MPEPSPDAIDAFISKWAKSGGHERGAGQYFMLDFCDLLGLEKPAAPVPENELNGYTFERRVDRRKPDGSSTPNWIDLYKSGHFVFESKQGVNARRDKTDPDQPLLPSLEAAAAKSLDLFEQLGGDRRLEMDTAIIRPGNFLGIEINSRAAAIAQLVLWIGYFQWHKKTTGKADTNDRPLLPKTNTIENRDAVLAYDEKIPRRDDAGAIVTVWDGHSTKPHPVTGKEVPDDSARTVLFDYVNPTRSEWPVADYIVGNPPFIGNKRMRDALGSGYVDALRLAWKPANPNSWDFVMFWWHNAAEMLRATESISFGFITTNSIHQSSNRVVLESALGGKKPCHIAYAIPDHPWVDSADGAAVRIAMTIAVAGKATGLLQKVLSEEEEPDGEHIVTLSSEIGMIGPDLKVGISTSDAVQLQANDSICFQGMNLVGEGFRVGNEEVEAMGYELTTLPPCIRHYQKGRELLQTGESGFVLDCFGLTADQLAETYPPVYQHLLVHVKPERDHNKRKSRKERWWLFGEPVGKLRKALAGLDRYIATVETSKFKPFVFLDSATVPDHKLYAVASDDAYLLGCLSAAPHQTWATHSGGALEDRPTWTNTTTFKPFPFPALEESPLKQRIRELGEKLDAHRKARQAAHPDLTLTGIYNVLEKLRAGEPLTDKDRKIHDQGLVTILKQIHDDLDAAVFEAYGWQDLRESRHSCRSSPGKEDAPQDAASSALHPPTPQECGDSSEAFEQELLKRLVALNHERAAEEKRGLVRWLRPDYQAPGAPKAIQPALTGTETSSSQSKIQNQESPIINSSLSWPASLPEQVAALHKLLPALGPDPDALAAAFGKRTKARVSKISEILETLKTLGKL